MIKRAYWRLWVRFHKPRTTAEQVCKMYRVPPTIVGLRKTPEGWK